VRATIFEVRKAGSRVKIILSRIRPDLVRRLFEQEIPEIADGVIEVRAMAREPGYRSKVAVSSSDQRVDCVGACVGVRGNRIKNIVDELGGERIDIVRWSDDLNVLIPNSLQPAEVEEVILCQMLGRAIVLVREDQLSLAIGRNGQNVRLASQLTGWKIDLYSSREWMERGGAESQIFAPLPEETEELEIHVRRLPGGAMSEWLHQEVQVGDTLTVAGPAGNCFYIEGKPEQGILLVATGSGLAPLWGIVRDALRQGHRGPITLFHGSWNPSGLYLVEELKRLAEEYPQFTYAPCVDTDATDGLRAGRADQNAFTDQRDLKGWRVFLCGHPDMVTGAKKKAFLFGAALSDIYADPFVLSARSA
jgi:transcription antitermination factor NusA-like protein